MKKKITSTLVFIYFCVNSVLAVLPTPMLTSPADASSDNPANTILNWYNVTGATSYEVKYNSDPLLTGALVQSTVSSQYNSSQLLYGTTYYWQVRALKTTGTPDTSAWTQIFSFSTSTVLTITAPSNGAVNQFPKTLLNWGNSGGVSNYQVQWDENNSFNSPELHDTLVPDSTSDVYTADVKFGTTYYWRVRGMHALDTMQWTPAYSFSTLNAVFLSAPAIGSSFLSPSILLNWDFIAGIKNYEVQIDKVPSFNSAAFQNTILADSISEWAPANLDFGANYYWRVRAWTDSDTTLWSQVWDFSTMVSLTLTAPSDNAIKQFPNVLLNWNYVTAPISYDVEFDTTASFSSPLHIYNSNDTISEYKTAELLYGRTYYWRARVHNVADTSLWSAIWSFTTIDTAVLSSPLNGATAIASKVTLNWNSVTGSTGYDIRIDTTPNYSSSSVLHFNSSISNQQVTNLKFGTLYYWSVRAHHTKDTSAWTGNWSFTTADQVVLTSPANNATGIVPHFNLNWTSLSGSSAYIVQYDTSASFSSPLLVSATSLVSNYYTSNLFFNQHYFWRVKAINLSDTSSWSPVWSFTTLYNQIVHTAPLDLAMGQALATQINWSGVSGAAGYIYRFDTSPLFNVSPQTGNSIGTASRADIVLPLYGQIYYWQVAVFDSVDTSGWSNPWSFTTLYQIANGPTLISPFDQESGIQLNAVPLSWNSVPSVSGYQYAYSTSPTFTNAVLVSVLDTTALSGQLASSTTYYWRVRATNAAGYSPWSSVFSFSTLNPLTAAPILYSPLNQSIGITQPLTFNWVSINFALNYSIEFDVDPTFSNPISTTTADTFFVYPSFNPLTTYYWRVRGSDGNSYSAWSSVWVFTTENPLTVAPLQLTPLNASIGLSTPAHFYWQPIAHASSYECEYDTDSLFSAPTTLLANDTSVFSQPLSPFTTYFWRVRGVWLTVSSPWSTTWKFRSDGASVPLPILPAYGDTGLLTPVTFKWNLITIASNYELAYATDSLFTNAIVLNSNSDNVQSLNLSSFTTYYWRVRAFDGTQFYAWSSVWNFTTSVMIGIQKASVEDMFYVYPNPASGELNLKFEQNNVAAFSVQLFSANGVLAWSKVFVGTIHEKIDLAGFSNGVYFLRIQNGEAVEVKKVIIK